MLDTIFAKVFGTRNEREIKRLRPLVERINALEPEMQRLSDAELRAKTDEFRKRINDRLSQVHDFLLGSDMRAPVLHQLLAARDFLEITSNRTRRDDSSIIITI